MVLTDHTEYLTRHPIHCGQREIWIGGTNGSRGYISLGWLQALHMLMDGAHSFLPGLLRCGGKGAVRCGLPASVFFLLEAPGPASAWATRSSHEAPSPTPPSIQDDSLEPSEVIGPLTPLFPVALGATAPHLLDLCCCWSVLGCSISPGGTGTPCR